MAVDHKLQSDPFAALALNVLMERVVGQATQLGQLTEQLRLGLKPDDWRESDRSLARACAQVEQHGWLFGLVARELGSDVLFERRERHGLELALDLVDSMLAAQSVQFERTELPALDPCDPRVTDICAVVARCLFAAFSKGEEVRWRFERTGSEIALHFEGALGAPLERAMLAGAARIPGSRLFGGTQTLDLAFPQDCLVWP